MAMVGLDCGELIYEKVREIPGLHIVNSEELRRFCDAVGEAVVEYVQENAQAILPQNEVVTVGNAVTQQGPQSQLLLEIQ